MTIIDFFAILLYLFLFTAWIRLATRNNKEALTLAEISVAQAFKVLMGCVYGYIFLTNYYGDDTWWLHEYSLGQTDLLVQDPGWFFEQLNPFYALDSEQPLKESVYYYLADLEVWLLTKPLAFVNFITGGNYYQNLVFFNVPVFIAQYWLFTLFRRHFNIRRMPLLVAVFLLPSVIFWLSGLRSDGILFFFLVLSIRAFDKILQKMSTGQVLLLILGFAGMVILRNAIAVLLVPAFLSWALVVKARRRPLLAFTSVYGIIIMLVVANMLFWPQHNAASFIVSRQQQYFALDGNTRFNLDTLRAEPLSFLRVLPQAVANSFLRPYPWEAKGALQLATTADILLLAGLILVLFYRPKKGWKQLLIHPLMLCLMAFSVSLFLVTGYTVPFPGAIVRYKVIGELFFFLVVVSLIDWDRWLRKRSDASIS